MSGVIIFAETQVLLRPRNVSIAEKPLLTPGTSVGPCIQALDSAVFTVEELPWKNSSSASPAPLDESTL